MNSDFHTGIVTLGLIFFTAFAVVGMLLTVLANPLIGIPMAGITIYAIYRTAKTKPDRDA